MLTRIDSRFGPVSAVTFTPAVTRFRRFAGQTFPTVGLRLSGHTGHSAPFLLWFSAPDVRDAGIHTLSQVRTGSVDKGLILPPPQRTAIMVGFIGGFTTFSTFALEDARGWLLRLMVF